MENVHPKLLKSGKSTSSRSSSVKFIRTPMLWTDAKLFRCIDNPPLGNPVVPDVYMIFMTSKGSTDSWRSLSLSSSPGSSPISMTSLNGYMPMQFLSPKRMPRFNSGKLSEWICSGVQSKISGHSCLNISRASIAPKKWSIMTRVDVSDCFREYMTSVCFQRV